MIPICSIMHPREPNRARYGAWPKGEAKAGMQDEDEDEFDE